MALMSIESSGKSKANSSQLVLRNTNDELSVGRAKKRRKVVLDEQTFTEDIDAIIERDYFPDLPKLKECLEYQQALEANDVNKINEIRLRWRDKGEDVIVEAGGGEQNSPSFFETPLVECNECDCGGKDDCEDECKGKKNENDALKDEKSGVNKSRTECVTLDQYLAKYTSEDNSSYETIIEEAKKRHRDKYPWMYIDEAKESQKCLENLSVPAIEQQADQKKSSKMLTWKYKNLNSVMFSPESAPLSKSELINRAKRQLVVHENTRFNESPFNEQLYAAKIGEAAYLHAKENKGKIGIDGKELVPGEISVNGYNLVSMTPSLSPSVMNTPLMTWGEIEGTPCRLDETPLHSSLTPGTPQFKIPEQPAREKLAHSLSDKLSKKNHDKKQQALKHVSSTFRTPSPLVIGSPRTPSERLSSMSPAAQKLATAKLGIHKHSDMKLRESYSPSPLRSQSSTPSLSGSSSLSQQIDRKKAFDFF
ncbi:protein DGCR14-like protein [Dinothrombium tinctorium]|uniref:Protein DGCR14-like protein n=1 Tax=Dinothrombium tinctorium TaxID=1965070 RepID=A0A3S3P9G2_9ACAR|nr:protein DGCR14-like protein [Dinothrombium tinctorium]RWS10527.1 protein DGCR14-like protein [Dinothrombium tinctorium]RWS10679.1 protein DGCR14-like protein [Dinothrombium tinctorium]RWS10715.1 protein DGCR14-like protein [Dinothrombium tinctorium]